VFQDRISARASNDILGEKAADLLGAAIPVQNLFAEIGDVGSEGKLVHKLAE
jgi:hypothetical protein